MNGACIVRQGAANQYGNSARIVRASESHIGMPGSARKDIVREGEIGVYHTWSRCVQRAFLCGEDPYTGQNFEHRRGWIKSLLEYQASIFACDIGNYSILSNHQHLIVRTRPDIAATWTDEEVAWRWKMAWPSWEDGQWIREPTDEEVEELLARPDRINVLRGNLASLSWLMARWKEPIAKLANAESQTKGHFYEARFGSRELVDEGAILCCSIYVDLNQIKAGMSDSLLDSDCSGIQDRLQAWRSSEAVQSVKKFYKREDAEGEYDLQTSHVEQLLSDCFLSPIDQQGPLMLDPFVPSEPAKLGDGVEASGPAPALESSDEVEPTVEDGADPDRDTEEEHDTKWTSNSKTQQPPRNLKNRSTRPRKPTRRIHSRLRHRKPRASDNVILSVPFPEYLRIAEWTVEQTRAGSTHPPPGELEVALRAKELDPLHWCSAVDNFAAWFHNAVGKTSRLRPTLERLGRKWIQGIRHCRDVFT